MIAIGAASSVIEFAGRDLPTAGNCVTSGFVWAASMVCGSLLGRLITAVRGRPTADPDGRARAEQLSSREVEVLQSVAKGASSAPGTAPP